MEEFSAVIVTYHPDVEHVKSTVYNLEKQGFLIIIIDNGSDNYLELKKLNSESSLVYGLFENKGIAFALNEGMRKADEYGSKWVLSLDQDSVPAKNMLDEYRKYIDLPNVGALCPRVMRKGKNSLKSNEQLNIEQFDAIDICPTAGFFLSVDSWKQTGGYDSFMFIDYVDYDMCMRLKRIDKKVYRISTTYVLQELGRIQYNKLIYKMGKLLHSNKLCNFSISYNHSPIRNYYFVRNGLYYINKYSDLLDVKYEKKKMIKWELKKIFHEKKRINQLKAIAAGIKDAKRMMKDE